MTDRAHIRNGEIIRRYKDERGWMTLEDGRQVSPIVDGFTDGNDKVVPINLSTVDNSTGDNKVSSRSVTVNADSVDIVTTIRDMTAQEADDRDTARVLSEADLVLGKLCFQLANQIRALQGNQALTKQQFITYVKGLL